jgi:hypothetical protein
MPVAYGPDFICIGMQKSGTGWLFDQLQHHPDFWMPPIKEIHYLDRDVPTMGNAHKILERMQNARRRKKTRLPRHRPWDSRDFQFLESAITLRGKPMNIAEYAALFRHKQGLISGDVTPGYSGMSDGAIGLVAAHLPDVRIVQLVRDPVERLWSQLSMASRRDKFDAGLLADADAFRAFLARANEPQEVAGHLIDIPKVSYPARVAERWARHAPEIRFRHFFFDDIANRPEEARGAILAYLGADPQKGNEAIPADRNPKSELEKLSMTDEIRAILAAFFAEELRACAARFGGHAETWARAYRVSP